MSPLEVRTSPERKEWNYWSMLIKDHQSYSIKNKHWKEGTMDEWHNTIKQLELSRRESVASMIKERKLQEKIIQEEAEILAQERAVIATEKRRAAAEKRKETILQRETLGQVRRSKRLRNKNQS